MNTRPSWGPSRAPGHTRWSYARKDHRARPGPLSPAYDGRTTPSAAEAAPIRTLADVRSLGIGAGEGYLLGRPTDRPSTAPIDLDGLGRGTDWLADTLRATPT